MKRATLAAASGLALCGLAPAAMAGQLVIELTTEFSNAAAPAGSAPWARATFTDEGGGVVGLLLECLLQDSNEFMAKAAGGSNNPKGWVFNLDPSLNADNLSFNLVSGDAASAIHTGANEFQAGPDRWYDLVFQWSGGLRGGDVAEYDLTISSGTLTAASFDFVSAGGPVGRTGWHSAAHVQGICNPSSGQGGSGWMGGGTVQAIPLPSAGVLGLAGLGLVASRRRRAIA